MTVDIQTLKKGLSLICDKTDFSFLGVKYEGKVRDNYVGKDGKRYIIVTDRISAFDRVIGTLPFKGQVLNQLSAWWFERTKDSVPNHVLDVPDPCVTVAENCEPLPVEFVMRSFLTGVTSTSIWTHYEKGERVFCGHALPSGMRKNQKLPEPILTPSTKAEKGGHDVSASRDEILKMGVISERDFDEAASLAKELFRLGQQMCAQRGLILVDTKYEFGKTKDGKIVVIDEIHTPDSSRFWYASSYQEKFEADKAPESFDKEYVRNWLANIGFKGDGETPKLNDEIRIEASRRYIEACETIRGEAFVLDETPPLARISKRLSLG